MGAAGSPPVLIRAGTTREPGARRTDRVTRRRGSYRSAAFVRDSSRTRRPRRGRTPPDRSDYGAEEEAEDMTAARGWRGLCRSDHWQHCSLGALSRVNPCPFFRFLAALSAVATYEDAAEAAVVEGGAAGFPAVHRADQAAEPRRPRRRCTATPSRSAPTPASP
jgi:hypothetical protein